MNYLEINKNIEDPILVNYDSQVAITFANDSKYYYKTKHIDTKYNYVKDNMA